MKTNSQSGQILLFAIVMIVVMSLIIGGLVNYGSTQIKSHRQAISREVALEIAEAGIESAIWKVNNSPGYTGETDTAYNNGVYTVTISSITASQKVIKVDSYIPNSTNPVAHRTVQVYATNVDNVGFSYAVQLGIGGLQMSNSSKVNGNIYSNGDIVGANSASITGSAVVAGTHTIQNIAINEDAYAYTISGSNITRDAYAVNLSGTTVGRNVRADSISTCTINGNATYDTRSSCTVAGTSTTPNNTTFSQPTAASLPIADDQVAQWEEDAAAGGTVGTQTLSSGTTNLGPIKINGNLDLSGFAIVNVTGTIWVTGNVSMRNSATIRLDTSYGNLAGVMVVGMPGSSANGTITVQQNSQIMGTGQTGSYLLMLSEKVDLVNDAITVNNSGATSTFYAAHGIISVTSSAGLKEIVAALVKLGQTAQITYDNGFASSQFSSGPAGSWGFQHQTYQILK